ncbi:autotransporter outer membrane beta-barrel domain-containing protein [Salmonella enterica subsp. enterica serovar Newport]
MKILPCTVVLISTNAFLVNYTLASEYLTVKNKVMESAYGRAIQNITGGASSIDNKLDGYSQQHVSGLGSTAINNILTDSANQSVKDNATVFNTSLSDRAGQDIRSGASATDNKLSGNSFQDIRFAGSAINNILTDNTSQNLIGGGSAFNTHLSGSALQMIRDSSSIATDNILTDNALQRGFYNAKSVNNTLSGSARQIISSGASSENNILTDSSSQTVAHSSTIAINNKLTDNATQKVYDKGKVLDTALSGNAVQNIIRNGISENNTLNDNSQQNISGQGSNATNNTLKDSALQNVLDGAYATKNTLSDNAVQQVWGTASVSDNALNSNSKQIISGSGTSAENNYLTDSAIQEVMDGASAINNILGGSAVQKISGGAYVSRNTLNENSLQDVNGSGSFSVNNTLSENAVQRVHNGGLAKYSILNGSSQQWVGGGSSLDEVPSSADYSVVNDYAVQMVGDNAKSNYTEVNDAGSVIINGNNALATNTQLNSGNIHVVKGVARDTSVAENGMVTLEQQGNLQGDTILNGGRLIINSYDIKVGDISDTIHARNNAQIQVNGSNNTLSNLNLSEGYVLLTEPLLRTGNITKFNKLNIGNLTGKGVFALSVDLATPMGDFVQIENASGSHGVLVKSTGRNPISANQLDIIAAKESDATFQLKNKGQIVDLGTYQYYLTNSSETGQTVWSLVPSADSGDEGGSISPSTDAVLSMVSATQFIADGEMQSLRFRHGDLRNNTGSNSGVWGRYLLNDTRIHAAEGASYELNQNGMEFGADNVIDLASGKLVLGGLAVFSDNLLDHSRGGQSSIKSYGLGGYATYFNNRGYYVDTVLKYNRFEDKLNAMMTDGTPTSGSYSQNALTTSFETGLNFELGNIVWVEPYLRGTYFVTDSKKFTLDNGMRVNTGVSRSARVEFGSTLGFDYSVGSNNVRPYVRASLENEFIKKNNITINSADYFNNDFSGVVGKYGIGISADVSDKANVYAEANYRKGHNLESPIVANLGVRINF